MRKSRSKRGVLVHWRVSRGELSPLWQKLWDKLLFEHSMPEGDSIRSDVEVQSLVESSTQLAGVCPIAGRKKKGRHPA
jgi:hypothetical protein